MAFPGDACDLEFGGCGRDIGVDPRTGGGDEIHRNGTRAVFSLCLPHGGTYAVDQGLVCRSEVGAAAGRCVISSPSAGGPGMEVAGSGEQLPDDPRSNDLSIFSDELSVGAEGKQDLSESGNAERIDHSKNQRGDE